MLCSYSPVPEYTELRPPGGSVHVASVTFDQSVDVELDTKRVVAEVSSVIRIEVPPSTSAELDNIPKASLSLGCTTDQNLVEGELELADTPNAMPGVPNKNVEKKALSFGLKDHIVFTPGTI